MIVDTIDEAVEEALSMMGRVEMLEADNADRRKRHKEAERAGLPYLERFAIMLPVEKQ